MLVSCARSEGLIAAGTYLDYLQESTYRGTQTQIWVTYSEFGGKSVSNRVANRKTHFGSFSIENPKMHLSLSSTQIFGTTQRGKKRRLQLTELASGRARGRWSSPAPDGARAAGPVVGGVCQWSSRPTRLASSARGRQNSPAAEPTASGARARRGRWS